MKRLALLGSFASTVAFVVVATAASESPPWASDPHGLVKPRGQAGKGGGPGQNLTYHGGTIMTGAAVTAIYWGTR